METTLLPTDSLSNDTPLNKKSNPPIEIIYQSNNVRIYGDTSVDKEKISHASLKFEPFISFDDFKISTVDNKSKAELNLNSHSKAKMFRTRLNEEYSTESPNFGGHYTFVSFGCGTACQNSLLIDRQTGIIYDSPAASLGYEFRADSRMLLVNPPDTSGYYDDCNYCKPTIFILDERTKIFSEKAKTKD